MHYGAVIPRPGQSGRLHSNVLVAVAAGKDGLAGIARDASFHAQREELGRFAHIVFSGQAADRTYWLGNHPDFAANRQTPKPCLHGCDAHTLEAVLIPDRNRLCWIRGEPTFDALRQTLVEPERRSHIGDTPPEGPHPGDVLRAFRVRNAGWAETQEVYLNDGLVTVIGAKGSGKTALADLAAFAAHASDTDPGPASFIAKAGELLDGLEVELEWGDGTRELARLPEEGADAGDPRVRYLSQQFVERLCSQSSLAEPLVEEIERVVFSAIPDEDRFQCTAFDELRAMVLVNPTAERDAEREAIRMHTRVVAEEARLQKALPALRIRVQETERERQSVEKEIATIPLKAADDKVRAHQAAAAKLRSLKEAVAAEERRAQDIRDVAAEVQRQARSAENALLGLRAKHPNLFESEVWDSLKLRVDEASLATLARLERDARERAGGFRERGLAPPGGPGTPTDGLAQLTAETEKLAKDLGLDEAKAKRRVELERRLVAAKANEERVRKELTHAEGSPTRKKEAQSQRSALYEKVFGALVSEEEELRKLYAPLRRRIDEDPRLAKLTFVVHRDVDVDEWASRGESLLDLRKPPFNHRGALAEAARASLLPAWQRGSPDQVRTAMHAFVEQYGTAAIEALAQGYTPLDLGEWLFSTDHLRVRYGIQYEGVEISRLSPGSRGVVLLTLYLGLDAWDRRPLIIDQPEENLDPRSVYADLVPFFREAALRRQVIMVTHNANLVVNTDSDQVIVAESERTSPTGLPNVRYFAGGLEDPEIRKQVCRLLEGGEDAFRRRGLRYGVSA
jgi:energy-coupling factor transporter ATP-binding protein EcfA2